MLWRVKARVQRIASRLPTRLSQSTYYLMQRRFGSLRNPDPRRRFESAIEIWQLIERQGFDPVGRVFLDVGTGRTPAVAIAYWLMGAESTISIDLNPYLKESVTRESLSEVGRNEESFRALFGRRLNQSRLDGLLALYSRKSFSIAKLLEHCRIEYVAPGDAANTGLPAGSMDFHTSTRVFEHIPPDVIRAILREGNRVVGQRGLFVHRIDYGDHFAHSDHSISKINFLQFSDKEWDSIAGNGYMYMNRLRHDDFVRIFEQAGHEILDVETSVDSACIDLLDSADFELDSRFECKPQDVLAIVGARFVSRISS